VKWKAYTTEKVLTNPRTSADGTTIFVTIKNFVYAVNANTGVELWSQSTGEAPVRQQGASSPMVSADRRSVFTLSPDGTRLSALWAPTPVPTSAPTMGPTIRAPTPPQTSSSSGWVIPVVVIVVLIILAAVGYYFYTKTAGGDGKTVVLAHTTNIEGTEKDSADKQVDTATTLPEKTDDAASPRRVSKHDYTTMV